MCLLLLFKIYQLHICIKFTCTVLQLTRILFILLQGVCLQSLCHDKQKFQEYVDRLGSNQSDIVLSWGNK